MKKLLNFDIRDIILWLFVILFCQILVVSQLFRDVALTLQDVRQDVRQEVKSIGNAVDLEYKIVRFGIDKSTDDIESELAMYADQCWELVNKHMLNMNGSHTVVDYIFKREKKINKI
jgi:hypothetical protein